MEKRPLNRIKVMLAERMLTNKELAEMPGKEPATMAKFLEATVDGLTQIGH